MLNLLFRNIFDKKVIYFTVNSYKFDLRRGKYGTKQGKHQIRSV